MPSDAPKPRAVALTRFSLVKASLRFFWRTHVPTMLALAVVTTTLTGALLVGHSMRASLLSSALSRLGPYETAVTSARFFSADVVGASACWDEALAGRAAIGAIRSSAGAESVDTGARVNRVNVWGVEQEFFDLAGASQRFAVGRGVILNRILASDLGVKVGDDVLLRVGKPTDVSPETLLGRRDEAPASLRLTVSAIAVSPGIENFALQPGQHDPRNAFVPLDILQRAIDQPARINLLLVGKRIGPVNDRSTAPSVYQYRMFEPSPRGAVASFAPLELVNDHVSASGGFRPRLLTFVPPGLLGSIAIGSRSAVSTRRLPDTETVANVDGGSPGPQNGGWNPPYEKRSYEKRIVDELPICLQRGLSLEDLGIRVRCAQDSVNGGVCSIETESFQIAPSIETSAAASLAAVGAPATSVFAYLANTIRVANEGAAAMDATHLSEQKSQAPPSTRAVPYSVVVGFDTTQALANPLEGSAAPFASQAAEEPGLGELLLNEWTATELGAKPGDRICIDYFVTSSFGRLETKAECFTLRDIAPMTGQTADRNWVPEYRGVTDVKRLSDWDPPFPMDLKLITPRDEDYWDKYRIAPKAFISLADARRLWAEHGERFGRLTSIRFGAAPGRSLTQTADDVREQLLSRIDLQAVGFSIEPIRDRAIAASRGSNDFGGLFIGFSMFLIAAALMLAILLFRLQAERRTRELGLLLAIGLTPSRALGLLLIEGAVLATLGALIGSLGAIGYCRLMIAGLKSWWSDAARAPFLNLHISIPVLFIGSLAGLVVAMLAIAWTLRGFARLSPRTLLSGALHGRPKARAIVGRVPPDELPTQQTAHGPPRPTADGTRPTFVSIRTAVVILVVLAVMLLGLSFLERVPSSGAFFGSGASLLSALLLATYRRLTSDRGPTRERRGTKGLILLGWDNARRNISRSMLTLSLIASATFVVVAVGAFRMEGSGSGGSNSGTGGFALVAESTVPLIYDLNTAEGRRSIGLKTEAEQLLAQSTVIPFRLRTGDEASCQGLYRPRVPRLLGATPAAIERGGFAFASSMAESEAESANPWRLLDRDFPDGAIPVIGDEAAVHWQLKLGLGKDLVIQDDAGVDRRLRFVALLRQSALQSEVTLSEANFTKLFPRSSGYSFFLIEAPQPSTGALQQALERDLSTFGFDASSIHDRLRGYLAVQNTYISTFQALGGLGLILGVLGLSAVLLRQVWERRSELALMTAVGFNRRSISMVVLAETMGLLVLAVASGSLAGIVAIAPQLITRSQTVPWDSLVATVTAVVVVGLTAAIVALRGALRAPLIPALRSE